MTAKVYDMQAFRVRKQKIAQARNAPELLPCFECNTPVDVRARHLSEFGSNIVWCSEQCWKRSQFGQHAE